MQGIKTQQNSNFFTYYYWSWIIPGIYASMPGVILSFLLRFDYQRHLDANPEANEMSQLESIPLPEDQASKLIKMGTGIAVPTKAPRHFRKTYYRTALAGCGLGQLLVIASFLVWPNHNAHSIPAVNVMMLIFPASVDIMIAFVFITALLRGDLKKLVRYKEAWKIKAVPAIAVATPALVDNKEVLIEIEEEKVGLMA